MFGSIGNGRGIGGPLRHAVPGENFIRHVGSDKLIFDFHEGSGTTVYDKSHCGNDGTFGAGATAPTWKRNSLYFDGGGYVVLTGYNHGITIGEFSICFFSDNLPTCVFFDQQTVRAYIRQFDSEVLHLLAKTVADNISTATKPFICQMTRDDSGNLECYINNKAGGKGQSNTLDITYDGTSIIALGSNYSYSALFVGTMYSFRILNKCLSGIEAQNEYLVNKFAGNN